MQSILDVLNRAKYLFLECGISSTFLPFFHWQCHQPSFFSHKLLKKANTECVWCMLALKVYFPWKSLLLLLLSRSLCVNSVRWAPHGEASATATATAAASASLPAPKWDQTLDAFRKWKRRNTESCFFYRLLFPPSLNDVFRSLAFPLMAFTNNLLGNIYLMKHFKSFYLKDTHLRNGRNSLKFLL